MECKLEVPDIARKVKLELIETLWNVNQKSSFSINPCEFELIETLWNVNMIGTLSPDMGHTGINRNIVECKFSSRKNIPPFLKN